MVKNINKLIIVGFLALSCSSIKEEKKEDNELKLTEAGKMVRVSNNLFDLVGCQLVTEIEGKVENPSNEKVIAWMQNEAAEVGGNTVANFQVRTSGTMNQTAHIVAESYYCQRSKRMKR